MVVDRKVYDYKRADWLRVRRALVAEDWRVMDFMTVDEAERHLHQRICGIMGLYIPQRTITERKSVHPWVNERCLEAIRTKNECSEDLTAAAAACSQVLFEEYLAHVQRMKDKLLREKRGSKQWLEISNEIMQKTCQPSAIPALKSSEGWVLAPKGKSDLFAETFAAKLGVPELVENEHSYVWPVRIQQGMVHVRSRAVQRVLEELDADSGTGPAGIATRFLKTCAPELSIPTAKLVRRIVSLGEWSAVWAEHWLMPLYKKKAVSDPCNYRAINLTSQMSKAVERILLPSFGPTLETTAFSDEQYAYRKKHGARDAVLLYVLSWIYELNIGNKVGVYCSDVSGAFDKVDAAR